MAQVYIKLKDFASVYLWLDKFSKFPKVNLSFLSLPKFPKFT